MNTVFQILDELETRIKEVAALRLLDAHHIDGLLKAVQSLREKAAGLLAMEEHMGSVREEILDPIRGELGKGTRYSRLGYIVGVVGIITGVLLYIAPTRDHGALIERDAGVARALDLLPIGSAHSGGVYQPIAMGIADAATRAFHANREPVYFSVRSTEGSMENLELLVAQEVQLAIVQADLLKEKLLRSGRVGRYGDIRILAVLHDEPIHIVVKTKEARASLDSLRGQKVAIGPPLSGTNWSTRRVLGGLDILINEVQGPNGDALGLLAGGDAKAYVLWEGDVSPLIRAMTLLPDTRLVSLTNQEVDRIRDLDKVYRRFVIPAGTYPEHGGGKIETVSVPAVLVCNKDCLSSEQVRLLLTAISDSIEDIKAVHGAAATMTRETLSRSIPELDEGYWHEGARSFFRPSPSAN